MGKSIRSKIKVMLAATALCSSIAVQQYLCSYALWPRIPYHTRTLCKGMQMKRGGRRGRKSKHVSHFFLPHHRCQLPVTFGVWWHTSAGMNRMHAALF